MEPYTTEPLIRQEFSLPVDQFFQVTPIMAFRRIVFDETVRQNILC